MKQGKNKCWDVPNPINQLKWIGSNYSILGASQVVLVVKNLPATGGDTRDVGLSPGSGKSPEGGHGNPLYYSCLENPIDRGAWWATVHRVTQTWTWLKGLSSSNRNQIVHSILRLAYSFSIMSFRVTQALCIINNSFLFIEELSISLYECISFLIHTFRKDIMMVAIFWWLWIKIM